MILHPFRQKGAGILLGVPPASNLAGPFGRASADLEPEDDAGDAAELAQAPDRGHHRPVGSRPHRRGSSL